VVGGEAANGRIVFGHSLAGSEGNRAAAQGDQLLGDGIDLSFIGLNGGKIGIFLDFCLDLAHHIYNLQAVIDAERVLIGGGISNEPMFIDLVREAVDQVFDHAIFQVIPKPDVMVCRFQADANLIGAVYNFIELQDLYEGNQFINI
jgi:hypothetical protein